MHPTRSLAERAVAIGEWLRRHPDVESGPSVRGVMAFTELSSAWRLQTGGDDLLRAALVSLPHRLRVRAGVDAEALVRAAVALVDSNGNGVEHSGDEDDPKRESRSGVHVPASVPSGGHLPMEADEEPLDPAFGEWEARRLLAALLPEPAADPLSCGSARTRPGRRSLDEEVTGVRDLRPGMRARDFSVRHTVRRSVTSPDDATGRHHWNLRGVARQPTAGYDVVLVLDASASMGQDRRPLVAPATAALSWALMRDGHRVGAIAFCDEAVTARRLSRSTRRPFPKAGYRFAHATNLEAGIEAGRRLLAAESEPGARQHLILITDAEATSFNDQDDEWRSMSAWGSRLFAKPSPVVLVAQRAALEAAARCRHQGLTVSVLYPDDDCDLDFALRLATAGGGGCRRLRY